MDKHFKALKIGQKLLKLMEVTKESKLSNKLEVLANIYSILGLSYLELNQFDDAFDAYTKAYDLGKHCNLVETVSCALDNLGRVYAKKGDFENAIQMYVSI